MDWRVAFDFLPIVAQGLWATISLSIVGIIGGTTAGILAGLFYESENYIIQRSARLYVEVMRNLPMLVKLFFLYFAVGLDAWPAAFLALILHQSGFISEVIASGVRAVPREQYEAAYTCGLTSFETARYIIIPQAFKHVIPPMTSQYVEVIKNSSVVMVIGVNDLTFVTQEIQYETFRYTEGFVVVTALYIMIAMTAIFAMNQVQKRMGKK